MLHSLPFFRFDSLLFEALVIGLLAIAKYSSAAPRLDRRLLTDDASMMDHRCIIRRRAFSFVPDQLTVAPQRTGQTTV
jgi:hypothetical protein